MKGKTEHESPRCFIYKLWWIVIFNKPGGLFHSGRGLAPLGSPGGPPGCPGGPRGGPWPGGPGGPPWNCRMDTNEDSISIYYN